MPASNRFYRLGLSAALLQRQMELSLGADPLEIEEEFFERLRQISDELAELIDDAPNTFEFETEAECDECGHFQYFFSQETTEWVLPQVALMKELL